MDNVRAKHTIASKHKFAKSIENMALNYGIGPYYGTGEEKYDATSEFVQKLSQYYKINRICDTNSLDDCWGYKIINFPSGETYDITKATNGKLFKNGGNENLADDYDNETRGILGTDLSYNKNCNELDPQIFTWNNDGTNNNAMNCIAAIIDIDGNKAPNRVGKDISFINATGIGDNCIIKIGDACFGALFQPEGVSLEECQEHGDDWGIHACNSDYEPYEYDYYAGAAKACGSRSNMISSSELSTVFKQMYSDCDSQECVEYKANSASDFGLVEPMEDIFHIWVSDNYSWCDYNETLGGIGSACSLIYSSHFAQLVPSVNNISDGSAYALCRM